MGNGPKPPAIHHFRVRLATPPETTQSVRAAYFQGDGTLIVFKDDQHQAVYAVHPDHLVSIERLDDGDQARDHAEHEERAAPFNLSK